MKKKIIGFILLGFMIFAACEKEEEVAPSYPPVEISGTYLGPYRNIHVSPGSGGGSTLVNDSAYAIVDTIRSGVYQYIICEDSLLMGTIYDTLTIRVQNNTLNACGEGASHFGHALSGGVQHYIIMDINCDTTSIETRYYPHSSHYGWGSAFYGVKLN